MPRLLLFAPCDNVLVSAPHNSVSLIIVISEVTFPSESPKTVAEKPTAAAMRWFVFSQWEFAADEAGFEFEQKIEMVGERKSAPLMENISAFKAEEGKPIHRMIAQLFAFPMVAGGPYRLILSLRAKGGESWMQVGDYPIQISYAGGPPAQVSQ